MRWTGCVLPMALVLGIIGSIIVLEGVLLILHSELAGLGLVACSPEARRPRFARGVDESLECCPLDALR